MILRSLPAAILALALLLMPSQAGGQGVTRSNEIGRPAEKDDGVTVGRFVFAGIGIDDYESVDLWKQLDNAVNDVDRMSATLQQGFDFEAPEEWTLRNEQASRTAIRQLIDDLGRNLQPDDNLVFFYAGHGAERPTIFDCEIVARTGYIVPVGVRAPVEEAPSQYLEIDRLLADLAALPSRHVLVIFDSCYSGLALDGSFKTRDGGTQQAQDLVNRRSRRVLTSAQADQLAADGGTEFPDNSLFTGWLTEGLRRAAEGTDDGRPSPDADDDGMITVTELFSFVSGRVGSASESRQTPDFGAFKFDNRGELVLTLERDKFEGLYRTAMDAFEEGKFDIFFTSTDEALELEPVGPRSSYLRYMGARIDDELALSLTSLRELSAFGEAGESVPMSAGELMIELRRAERRCQKSDCEALGN